MLGIYLFLSLFCLLLLFFFFFLFNRDGFRSPEVIIFRDDNQSRHRLDTDVTNFIVSSSSLVERKIFFFPMNIIRLSREVDKLPIVCHVSYKLEVRRIFYSSCIHRDRWNINKLFFWLLFFFTSVDHRVKIRMCDGFVLRSVVNRYVFTYLRPVLSERNRRRPTDSRQLRKRTAYDELFIGNR